MSKLDRAADTALQGAMDRAVARALHDWPNRKPLAEDARRAGSTARPARKPGKRSEAPRRASPAPEWAFDAASFLRSIASDERDLSDEAGEAEYRDALSAGPTGSLMPEPEDSLRNLIAMLGELSGMHIAPAGHALHRAAIKRLLSKIASHESLDDGASSAGEPDDREDENEGGVSVPPEQRSKAIAEGEAAERARKPEGGANAGASDTALRGLLERITGGCTCRT